MKIDDLEKAVEIAKALRGAEKSLSDVEGWIAINGPVYVHLGPAAVSIRTEGAWSKIHRVILDLLEKEIRSLKSQLLDLGVYGA